MIIMAGIVIVIVMIFVFSMAHISGKAERTFEGFRLREELQNGNGVEENKKTII